MKKTLLEYLFLFLIFPGFLFSVTIGLIVGWIERKITARVQWRVGPPWYQNFIDIIKLSFYKETSIPAGAPKAIFLGMPLVAISAATLVSTIVFFVNAHPAAGFIGDLIVVVFLLLIPSIALMIGGFASRNVYAALGSSREMKLMLAYELPFLVSLAAPIIKTGYTIRLGDIITSQCNNGSVISSASGLISFVVMLLCIQAKLGLAPFDMTEAETEIVGGPYIEYSGKALALFKLTKAVMTVSLPFLMITLLFGGIRFDFEGLVRSLLQFLFIIILTVLIRNTNPRVRIDQAVRFFLVPVTGIAIVGAILAYVGH